jgi:hypothetical protein
MADLPAELRALLADVPLTAILDTLGITHREGRR